MCRAANIFHTHLFACTTAIGEFMSRVQSDGAQCPGNLDGVGGWRGEWVEFIVDYDGGFEGVYFLEIEGVHCEVCEDVKMGEVVCLSDAGSCLGHEYVSLSDSRVFRLCLFRGE